MTVDDDEAGSAELSDCWELVPTPELESLLFLLKMSLILLAGDLDRLEELGGR